MNSYLFYDLETTGLNRTFDQIIQFAAVRTDRELKQLEELNIKIRLRPDIIPSPTAMLTHGISTADLTNGPCEFDAITTIHRLFNTPGTVTIGYNSLGFDDEFLRFAFYRNLLPPYTHQYANGCFRMDLLAMVVIYWLYNREIIQWPNHDGRPSIKLEHINALNRLAPGPAHDALADVQATVELARRLQSAPRVWNYLAGYFDKATDLSRMESLSEQFQSGSGPHRLGLLATSALGFKNNFQAPILSIGGSNAYKNQSLWLRLDLPELQKVETETVDENTWVVRKKAGEPGLILPPLERYWEKISPERRELTNANLQWLQDNPDLFREIIQYHADFRYPVIPDLDVDAALYQSGFWSNADQEVCRAVHAAPVSDKAELINRFNNKGLRQLARRVLFRNFPESRSAQSLRKDTAVYMQKVAPPQGKSGMSDFRGRERRTPARALGEIKTLTVAGDLNTEHQQLLEALKAYITTNFE
ncbi:MAG: exodeoxyribonuclease I [Desulfobacterales bacterium]|nr:exodeoxyribonuclease I [Desulfobacterales bacterium]